MSIYISFCFESGNFFKISTYQSIIADTHLTLRDLFLICISLFLFLWVCVFVNVLLPRFRCKSAFLALSCVWTFSCLPISYRMPCSQRNKRAYQICEKNIQKPCTCTVYIVHDDTLGIKADNCILIRESCVEMWLYFMECRWGNTQWGDAVQSETQEISN